MDGPDEPGHDEAGTVPKRRSRGDQDGGEGMTADVTRLADIYRRFADREAVSRSPLYVEICEGIAGDGDLLSLLVQLPLEKRQPNLLLAAVKYLYGVSEGWPDFRSWVLLHWNDVEPVILARRTQTNEPARCATLLPLLAQLPPPLALLEVGASAGLCLLPDYYAYDYGAHQVSPAIAVPNAPLFHCTVNPATPVPPRNLDVIWRAGLDPNPLDLADPSDTRWLEALVWPGEGERARLLQEALALARRDPPRIMRGDLRHDLRALAAEAPKDATLVIFHTAVLAYVHDQSDRAAFADMVRALGAQWVSNESAEIFNRPDEPPAPWGKFLLSLNGCPVAYTDPHGAAIEWLTA
jgi:hypothetical protein